MAGGFAEVTGTRCTVLAEEALPVSDIDRAAVEKGMSDYSRRPAWMPRTDDDARKADRA